MEKKDKKEKKVNKRFLIVLILIVLVAGTFGIQRYIYSLSHESTDNAQIMTDIAPIIPHVGGYIQKVYVKDDQYVKKGDTLLVIDNREYILKLREAEAALAIAESSEGVSRENISLSRSQVLTASASASSAKTSVETAQIRVWQANKEYDRYSKLYKDGVVSEQQFDQIKAEKETADKQLKMIMEQEEVANHQKSTSEAQSRVVESQVEVSKARIEQAKAGVSMAELNVGYCVITAPSDGKVSEIDVVQGRLVQPGQPLFNLVLLDDVHIVANFKETQIENMKEGQMVEVEVDAFPDLKVKGRVESLAPGTGSVFTLLPPDNSTGNFVKVVQRIPVRIALTENKKEVMNHLRPGLSVEVTVETL